MKKIFLFLCLSINSISLFAQISIADARAKSEGTTITVRGIVTNGNELGEVRYLQDGTAGIAAYAGSSNDNFLSQVKLGDSIEITGVLKTYRELLEIDPINSFQVISSNNNLPTPKIITPDQLGEANESELVKMECINFTGTGNFNSGLHIFQATNGTSAPIYIRREHPLENTMIPTGGVELVGISSVFGDAQLLLRNSADIVDKPCFFIDGGPIQSNIKTNGFQLNWTTNEESSTKVRYGLTAALGSEITIDESVSNHIVELNALEAAEFYYAQTVSVKDGFEAVSPIRIFSTASLSSGEIQVYFNQSIDASFSTGEVPLSSSSSKIEAAILNRINNAKQTIDFCAYNINRDVVVTALKAAQNRGVQIRYIRNDGTSNTALTPTPSFPILAVNSEALMHNKYIVIDAAMTDDSWVLMGSLNFTEGNLFEDFNNMVFIQDEALAKAYTWEFEEIWGSDQAQPNAANSKAGAFKKNNTPHEFMVNGKRIESYFSPSDNTTNAIVKAMQSADADLQFAVLSFTKDEIGAAVKAAKTRSVRTRGIIESSADQGSEFDFLKNAGIAIVTHPPSPTLHHKYAIIDASNIDSDPMVITGSHNWSSSAENRNDENTLIIHDATVANLFIQEFEARWKEVWVTAVQLVPNIQGVELDLYPIPVTNQLQIAVKTKFAKELTLKLWNLNGQLLQTINLDAPVQRAIDLQGLSNGLYIVSLQTDKEMMMRKIEVLR